MVKKLKLSEIQLDSFYPRKGMTPSNHCRECSAIIFKERNTLEYRERRKKYMKEYYKINKREKWGIKI